MSPFPSQMRRAKPRIKISSFFRSLDNYGGNPTDAGEIPLPFSLPAIASFTLGKQTDDSRNHPGQDQVKDSVDISGKTRRPGGKKKGRYAAETNSQVMNAPRKPKRSTPRSSGR